jgi:hypothetical protein
MHLLKKIIFDEIRVVATQISRSVKSISLHIIYVHAMQIQTVPNCSLAFLLIIDYESHISAD